jgi:chemotaxis protein methyltransferase CheR
MKNGAEGRLTSDEQGFSLLKRRIFLDRGLDCEQYKENYLKRRIAVRLRATEASDYMDYLRILRTDPDEYTRLMNELTINVTQFFRDKDVYLKLRSDVLPGLVKAKARMGSRTLRIWSAGCASGEEPYSVAIMLEEVMGDDISRWNVRVLGSDFDEKSLAVAREGSYQNIEMLEGIDAERYFEISPGQDHTVYRVRDEIKRRVRFEKMNLLAESEARHFDLVLCRNVLIYFGRSVQTKIIETLSSSILRDGYLVLGKSETLGPEASQLFRSTFTRERIYQLIGDNRSEGDRKHRAAGKGGFEKDR